MPATTDSSLDPFYEIFRVTIWCCNFWENGQDPPHELKAALCGFPPETAWIVFMDKYMAMKNDWTYAEMKGITTPLMSYKE